MKTLADIQKELRDTLPEGIDLVIQAIKNVLPNGTDKYNDLILIEARYREVNHQLLQGILSNEDAQLAFNKIRKDILDFINSLTDSHLAKKDGATQAGQPDIYNGEVFYRIPDQMVLNEEIKCIVRVAFDRQILLEGIEVKQDDVVKDIRISDVMGVELLDPDPENAFAIRTFSDAVQFVDKDLSTEWLFYVKPLKAGNHPLILKISVIEIKEGVERKRTVVLEEQVEIFTTPIPEKGEAAAFVSAGVAINMANAQQAGKEEVDRGGAVTPPPPQPGGGGQIPYSPVIEPGPLGPSPKSPFPLKRVMSALSALLVLVVASFALFKYLGDPNKNDVPSVAEVSSVKELENIKRQRPGSPEAIAAQEKIDSLDAAFWSKTVPAADTTQLLAYIKEFPDGKHVTEAYLMLEQARKPLVKDVIFSWQLTDSVLNVNLDGGVPPYFFSFINADTTYKQVSRDSGGAFSIPRPEIAPGNYELILQDAEGRSISDSLFVEKLDKAPVKKEEKKPTTGVTRKRKKPAPPKPEPPKTNPTVTPTNTPTKPKEEPATETPPQPEKPVPMKSAARKPIYKGCDKKKQSKQEKCTVDEIRDFIRDRIKYPDEALRKGIEGTVNVEFVVEKDGSITDVKYLNEIGGGCGAEAVRLVKMMPRFKPGLSTKGDPVRVLYQLPITFRVR
ncbi:MAG: TonB family protein [Saprospiraceae bacterium]